MNRGTEDKAVCLRRLFDSGVHSVFIDAFPLSGASAAAHTAADGSGADMENFRINAAFLQGLCNFGQCSECTAIFVGASVN